MEHRRLGGHWRVGRGLWASEPQSKLNLHPCSKIIASFFVHRRLWVEPLRYPGSCMRATSLRTLLVAPAPVLGLSGDSGSNGWRDRQPLGQRCVGSYRQMRRSAKLPRLASTRRTYLFQVVLDGDPCPDATGLKGGGVAAWKAKNNRYYPIIFFAISGSVDITVRTHEGNTSGPLGNEVAAWKALMERSIDTPRKPGMRVGTSSTLQSSSLAATPRTFSPPWTNSCCV